MLNYSFVDAVWETDFAEKRQSDQGAKSDSQPNERDAHDVDRQLGGQRALQPESQVSSCSRV